MPGLSVHHHHQQTKSEPPAQPELLHGGWPWEPNRPGRLTCRRRTPEDTSWAACQLVSRPTETQAPGQVVSQLPWGQSRLLTSLPGSPQRRRERLQGLLNIYQRRLVCDGEMKSGGVSPRQGDQGNRVLRHRQTVILQLVGPGEAQATGPAASTLSMHPSPLGSRGASEGVLGCVS